MKHVAIVGVRPLQFLRLFDPSLTLSSTLHEKRAQFLYGIPSVEFPLAIIHSFNTESQFPDYYFRPMKAFIVLHQLMRDDTVSLFRNLLEQRHTHVQGKPIAFILKCLETEKGTGLLHSRTEYFHEYLNSLIKDGYFKRCTIKVFHEQNGPQESMQAVEWLFTRLLV